MTVWLCRACRWGSQYERCKTNVLRPARRHHALTIHRDEEFMKTGLQVDFDVMVEVAFADEDAFLAYMGKLFGPEAVDDAVAVDEAKFLDRSQTRAYVVDEHVTVG